MSSIVIVLKPYWPNNSTAELSILVNGSIHEILAQNYGNIFHKNSFLGILTLYPAICKSYTAGPFFHMQLSVLHKILSISYLYQSVFRHACWAAGAFNIYFIKIFCRRPPSLRPSSVMLLLFYPSLKLFLAYYAIHYFIIFTP
jgi:hypothetical protein